MYADRVKGGRGRGRGSRPTPYSRPGGGEEAAADACTVFVGNLPYETTWKELKDHMKQAGEVAHADVMEGPDGRSKGTGLVRYYSEEDAVHAIETLSESEIDGRTIFVRADRGGGGGGKGKGKGSKGSKGGSKGKGKGGKGKGGKMSLTDLDDDLDAYMGGTAAPKEFKAKKASNLDDDLDDYFSKGGKEKAEEAAAPSEE